MIQLQAKTYSSGAEMMDAARSLRYLHAPAVSRPRPKPVPLAVPVREEPAERINPIMPDWMGCNIEFDAHIKAWDAWKARYCHNSRLYLKERAVELGFTYEELVVDDRRVLPVLVRSLLMWELKTYLKKSNAEIRRLFGNRDHSTVHHAIRRIGRLKAEGKL